jgi:hypothetical protein
MYKIHVKSKTKSVQVQLTISEKVTLMQYGTFKRSLILFITQSKTK